MLLSYHPVAAKAVPFLAAILSGKMFGSSVGNMGVLFELQLLYISRPDTGSCMAKLGPRSVYQAVMAAMAGAASSPRARNRTVTSEGAMMAVL